MITDACDPNFYHALGSACNPYPIYHAPLTTDPTAGVLMGFALGVAVVTAILVLILFNNRNN